CQHGYGILDSF
nr:immunoglobulin light chain junction region [Macaca mulatta]MOW33734.1 immunoglobulin light chain junction region [Macaca mulatta]MOW33861.1 immunoglobulin light chain junction region [Macaca mulatta]MOW34043.1 immunoglobulin light chain junction region [Macaca mulatta]MOW34057.1 immunoglobulin light chain junction region [Macaca mulatta]